MKKTIRDYDINEDVFLSTLDEMTEQAFDDQCTGANPRYPLISEIKEIINEIYNIRLIVFSEIYSITPIEVPIIIK